MQRVVKTKLRACFAQPAAWLLIIEAGVISNVMLDPPAIADTGGLIRVSGADVRAIRDPITVCVYIRGAVAVMLRIEDSRAEVLTIRNTVSVGVGIRRARTLVKAVRHPVAVVIKDV